MLNESRKAVYDYISSLVSGTVTDNVHKLEVPTELTQSELRDGFIVIRVGELNDESEFRDAAYGWARCYIDAYIPLRSRGRFNGDVYGAFEDAIDMALRHATLTDSHLTYWVMEDSFISYDYADSNINGNTFHVMSKSFIVNINESV